MFGFGKGKGKNDNKKKTASKKGSAQKPSSREELIKQAMSNAQKAREEIGEENIQRMAEELKKIQGEMQPQPSGVDSDGNDLGIQAMDTNPSHTEDASTAESRRAKRKLQDMDKRVLASHLRDIIDEDKY